MSARAARGIGHADIGNRQRFKARSSTHDRVQSACPKNRNALIHHDKIFLPAASGIFPDAEDALKAALFNVVADGSTHRCTGKQTSSNARARTVVRTSHMQIGVVETTHNTTHCGASREAESHQ